jgi:hypothetical protein
MLQVSEIDPEANRRRTLGKVYALLIRLAEEEERQTSIPNNTREPVRNEEGYAPVCVINDESSSAAPQSRTSGG